MALPRRRSFSISPSTARAGSTARRTWRGRSADGGPTFPCTPPGLSSSNRARAVGGRVILPPGEGRFAAETALKILRGDPVSSIPIRWSSPKVDLFHREGLARFGISQKNSAAGKPRRRRQGASLWALPPRPSSPARPSGRTLPPWLFAPAQEEGRVGDSRSAPFPRAFHRSLSPCPSSTATRRNVTFTSTRPSPILGVATRKRSSERGRRSSPLPICRS